MTGQQVMTFGSLNMEDTWWALDPDQKIHFEGVQRVRMHYRLTTVLYMVKVE